MTIYPSLLSICLLFVGCPAQAQTDFEKENKEQLERNPPGVTVTLGTTGGKPTFHLFETIPIELIFQSSRPATYSIELDEVMNAAGQSNWFKVAPVQTVFLPGFLVPGIVCCWTNRHYLSSEPTILKRELTDYLRFESAGTYSISYSTNRVFRGLGKKEDPRRSPLTVTSNVLTITILPDDPEWDALQLVDTLKKLEDPDVHARYAAAMRHAGKLQSETARNFYNQAHISQTEFVRAQKALNVMDTQHAIRERIRLMRMNSKEDLKKMRDLHSWTAVSEPLLSATTRPDIVVACMRERAETPEFGVDYNYVFWWSRFLAQQEHPDLFRPSDGGQHYGGERATAYSAVTQTAMREVAVILQSALANKRGDAADLTVLTLKIVDAGLK